MDPTPDRRSFVLAASAVVAGGLAGCLGDDGGDGAGGDDAAESPGDVEGCPPATSDEGLELLPEPDGFELVQENTPFDDVWASYRGPDGSRYMIQIRFHDSEEEAENYDRSLGGTGNRGITSGGESWSVGAGLRGRLGLTTIEVMAEDETAVDEIETLYGATACYTEDHVVERSWE